MTETSPKTKVIQCPTCSGFGTIGDGPFTVGTECPECGGAGVL